MRFQFACAIAGLVLLSGCGDGREELADAAPATGGKLVDYSTKITDGVSIDKDASLFQRFCVNMTLHPCQEDIGDKLKPYGFSNGQPGVDLGYAFALLAADEKDGSADGKSSDADFIHGAYRAAFGREADPGGVETYSAVIKEGTIESRKVMIKTLLQSPEFRSMK